MSDASKTFGNPDTRIADYVSTLLQLNDDPIEQIRSTAEQANLPPIHVSAFDGRHIAFLAALIKAEKIVEIGTLGGYSGTQLARQLPPNGKLYTFELNQINAKIALENFKTLGVSEKVEIFVGPATENLSKIEKFAPFDLVFIDADKRNYPNYANWAKKHLKVGGLIVADNTFAFGHIFENFDTAPDDSIDSDNPEHNQRLELQVKSLREFNQMIAEDPNFLTTLLPTGEGLTLGLKIK